MSDEPRTLESMSCEELLREMARLTSERDRISSEVATPTQAGPENSTQVDALFDQNARLTRIGELLEAKGCQG